MEGRLGRFIGAFRREPVSAPAVRREIVVSQRPVIREQGLGETVRVSQDEALNIISDPKHPRHSEMQQRLQKILSTPTDIGLYPDNSIDPFTGLPVQPYYAKKS